jgi:hypothetical protein
MDRLEWLARYKAHNDALAKRLEGMNMTDTVDERPEPHVVQHLSPAVGLRVSNETRLLVSRLHRVAARIGASDVRDELYMVAEALETMMLGAR